MYDLNMKEIKFPEGLMPLDIFVGSIAKERATETIEGRNGIVDYGTNYVDRPVELSMWINSSDTTDYRLLRNELYALFDTGNAFYIEETRVPSRVLKVAVDESFIPDRLTIRNASVDVTCRTLDSVFWESKYTTLELHDSGYDATADKYGLVDNINQDYLKYVYEPNFIDILLYEYPFEKGMISSASGENATSSRHVRSAYIEVLPGQRYTIQDKGINNQLDYWWVFEYDVDGKYIGSLDTNGDPNPKKLDFIARGNMIRIMPNPKAEEVISLSSVGSTILPVMTGPPMEHTIEVYNAGNVTIEPESMFLELNFSYVSTGRQFVINNLTTEESFVYKRIENRTHIKIQGLVVTRGLFNAFRLTNRKFISLAPGVNRIKISGGTFESLSINTKFYYK